MKTTEKALSLPTKQDLLNPALLKVIIGRIYPFKNSIGVVSRIILFAVFLLMAVLTPSGTCYSQLSIVNSDIYYVHTSATEIAAECNVSISDTLNCQAIEIILYDAFLDSIIFSNVFGFDQTTGLPSGQSYFRKEHDIKIALGILPICQNYDAKIRLKDSSGTWTAWDEFLF